jgi:TonB family protein
MSALVMALALALSPSPVAVAGDVACPEPGMALPRYPADRLFSGTQGKTLVLARIDDCGRVVEATVETGSGHSDLDEAALVAARASVLSPEQRARVPTGWVKLPFAFGGLRNVTPVAPDWPASHRRPRYLPDDQPIGFETIRALKNAKLMRPLLLKSPYGSASGGKGTRVITVFEQEQANPRHFWLSYVVQTGVADQTGARRYTSDVVAMARYRLVQEAGEPVVRLAVLCEASADDCAQISGFLLEGLPTAKAARR